MGENDLVSMKIDDGIVRSVLEKQIQAAIAANLGSQEGLIAKAVTIALRDKVSSNGTKSKYDSDNKFDYLEVISNRAIQAAAKEALCDWLANNSKKIRNAVLTEIKKPARQKSLAKAFADAVETSIKTNWRTDVSISFDTQ